MSLSSLYLDAFAEVARVKSFSKAAQKLNITQSALSQRVLNLEQELGSSVFIRESSGLRLTELGQRLLRYCHSKSLLEDEFLQTLKSADEKELSGLIRIGTYSTVGRSLLLPALAKFLKTHPRVGLELRNADLGELPGLLASGVVDLVLLAQPLEKQGVENHLLGYEKYMLIQPTVKTARQDVYLDFDENDTITFDFFKQQKRKTPPLTRDFLSDIDSLIDGVKLGVGRAVIPQHLFEDLSGIEAVKGYEPLKIPVYLTYYTQAFFTKLQARVIEIIREEMTQSLA